jgi:pimeloyl-ACP methyl ester carboxylesterase
VGADMIGTDMREGPLRMSTSTVWTYFQAPTQIVRTSTGTDFAYRRVGDRGGTPLVLGNYFAANMDDWDPLIVDRLATDRDVIAFDYPGIGGSAGSTAATVAELAAECVAFLAALGLTTVDFLGFSLGGMVAQQIASSYPEAIRRMILCGSGPRGGVKMTFTELSIADLDDPEALLLMSFFTPSDVSQAAGRAYLGRLDRPEAERDVPVARTAAEAQLVSIREWGTIPTTDRYAMLKAIHHPTLIVHGTKDVVVDVANAVVLEENLSDAILVMLPDASHGAQSQYADVFLANAKVFLATETRGAQRVRARTDSCP